MESKNKKLRSGYTTGACAAAAAKAATLFLVRCHVREQAVEIPFPDGSRVRFAIQDAGRRTQDPSAWASVIKDAGDDPDVTNGAEIVAEVRFRKTNEGCRTAHHEPVLIKGGKGVGMITKPGLAVPIGESAINPVPRRMIRDAVQEAVVECGANVEGLEVTISVPSGEELAKKTLNDRLGILGGLSILGTTGIVHPVSDEAYTASITSALDVAKAMGNGVVVLSSGRTSEKAHMKRFHLPEEAYVMMGDYVEFALADSRRHGFEQIHLCAQWAKMVKIAMGTPQTHVRHGALEAEAARDFLIRIGMTVPGEHAYNTTREIYDQIKTASIDSLDAFRSVCLAARTYCEKVTGGIPVAVHLVSYEGDIVAGSE